MTGGYCKVLSRVRVVGSDTAAHRLEREWRVGPFSLRQDPDAPDWSLAGEVQARNVALAAIQARHHLIALGGALTLATRCPYWALPARIFLETEGSATGEDAQSERPYLEPEQMDLVLRIQPLAASALPREPRVQIIIVDLEAASRDYTKFCLVHLQRVLETMKGTFGEWADLGTALGFEENYLHYISNVQGRQDFSRWTRERASGEYDLLAHIARTPVTTQEVDEAWTRVTEAVRAYLVYLNKGGRHDA